MLNVGATSSGGLIDINGVLIPLDGGWGAMLA